MATGRRRSDMPWRILLFYQCGGAERAMGIELLSDESVLRFHEDIRQQVAADLATEDRFDGRRSRQAKGRAFADRDRPPAPAVYSD